MTFAERKFYQDMVRAIYSHKDEDGSSVCSEDNDDTYILDSEDDAFKVTKSVKDYNIHYHLNFENDKAHNISKVNFYIFLM